MSNFLTEKLGPFPAFVYPIAGAAAYLLFFRKSSSAGSQGVQYVLSYVPQTGSGGSAGGTDTGGSSSNPIPTPVGPTPAPSNPLLAQLYAVYQQAFALNPQYAGYPSQFGTGYSGWQNWFNTVVLPQIETNSDQGTSYLQQLIGSVQNDINSGGILRGPPAPVNSNPTGNGGLSGTQYPPSYPIPQPVGPAPYVPPRAPGLQPGQFYFGGPPYRVG